MVLYQKKIRQRTIRGTCVGLLARLPPGFSVDALFLGRDWKSPAENPNKNSINKNLLVSLLPTAMEGNVFRRVCQWILVIGGVWAGEGAYVAGGMRSWGVCGCGGICGWRRCVCGCREMCVVGVMHGGGGGAWLGACVLSGGGERLCCLGEGMLSQGCCPGRGAVRGVLSRGVCGLECEQNDRQVQKHYLALNFVCRR